MFDEDFPSTAAILLADLDVSQAIRGLDDAFAARRYRRWDQRLPTGYPASPGEWIGLLIAPIPAPSGVCLMPSDLGLAFEVARWVSAAFPEQLVVAWKRLRGGEPAAKFLTDGLPRWKDGEDADLEVDWHVPRAPPTELVIPPRRGLPDSAAAASELLRDVVRPFPRDLVCAPGEAAVGYLERSSPLAR